jgi:RNase H
MLVTVHIQTSPGLDLIHLTAPTQKHSVKGVQAPCKVQWECGNKVHDTIIDASCALPDPINRPRCELNAVIRTLMMMQRTLSNQKIVISSILCNIDSDYVLKNIDRVSNWKRRGYKREDGSYIENRDLWNKLYDMTTVLPVTFYKPRL